MLTIARFDFIPQYRMRGFLKAAFDKPVAKLEDQASGAISVQLPVNEGSQYKLAGVQWSGNRAFSNDELGKLLTGKVGMPLNQPQFEEDLKAMSKLYRTRGFMEAHLKPEYTLADADHSVTTEVAIQESEQFHFGELRFTGLSADAAAPLRKLWKLHAGDVYDSSYPNRFLVDAARQFDLRQFRIGTNEKVHKETGTVDVEFQISH